MLFLSKDSVINLTKNEINYIIKVIRYLENTGILLKGTTKHITSQKGGFLNFLRQLMTAGLPLMKNVLTPLAKSVLVPLRSITAASATNAAIQKKSFKSEIAALINSNKEIEDIMKIDESLEECGLLIKVAGGTIKNEAKEKRWISRNVIRYISC